MITTANTDIASIFKAQRSFFRQGATREASGRRKQLERLKSALEAYQDRLLDALYTDLRKPRPEAFFLDFAFTYKAIDHALKNFEAWMKPERISPHLLQTPAAAYIQPEPYGVTAVIAPWNFPIYLLILPAVGAIAAGNTVILKPSEQVPHTSALLDEMVKEYFDPQWVALVQGAVEETQTLLAQPLDYIFFTGGTAVGKIVMKAAANHLTPVTLELGGKSPVILDRQTNLATSVKRIVWGKYMNSGQACIAPDYVLVPSDKMDEVISLMRNNLLDFYGVDPQQSPDYSRIVNERHFDRVAKLIEGEVRIGGQTDREDLFISPTIIKVDNPQEHPAMQEEIFGPVLPLIPYDYLPQAIDFVNERPKPLVCYIFSTSTRNQNRIIAETSSGGVCINDTILHWSLSDLPIGGVGDSGMGKAHGKAAFDTFSHQKSVMKRSFLIDPTSIIRFPPYNTPLGMLKDLVKWFG